MEDAILAMLLDSDSESASEEVDNYDLLSMLALALGPKALWLISACTVGAFGHTASTHDSTADKATRLYKERSCFRADNEYLLADKAFELDKHLITPYKMPIARQPSRRAFNRAHSVERIQIDHALVYWRPAGQN